MLSNPFIALNIKTMSNKRKSVVYGNRYLPQNIILRKYASKKFSLKNLKPSIKWDTLYYPKLDERIYGKGANRWAFWQFLWYSIFKESEKWYQEGYFYVERSLDASYGEYDENAEWDHFMASFASEAGKFILFEPDYMREWDYNMNDVFVMDFIFDENFVVDALLFLLLIYFFLDKYVAVLFLYFLYISYESIIRSTRKLDEGKYGAETLVDESTLNYEFYPYTYTEFFMEKGKEKDYLNFYYWNNQNVKKYFINFNNKFGGNRKESLLGVSGKKSKD